MNCEYQLKSNNRNFDADGINIWGFRQIWAEKPSLSAT